MTLLVLFLLTLALSSALIENDFKIFDYVLFVTIILIGIAIQKRKTLILNKELNTGLFVSQTIVGKTETRFTLNNIKSVEMVLARGKYAKGGSIYMQLRGQDQHLVITDSDITGNSEKLNKLAKNAILQFIYSSAN